MKRIAQLLCLTSSLSLLSSPLLAQQTTDESPTAKADQLVKDKKYDEALALYDIALKNAQSSTPEQILKTRKILTTKSWIYRMKRNPEKVKTVLKQTYEFSTDAAKKFPKNKALAQNQILDLAALARSYSKPQDLSKKTALQLQAVALAEALATTHPNDQSVLHTQFKSQLDLAKSYRWSAENRAKTPATVDKGMELLEKINSQSLPQWETKAYLTLQIASLKVAVHSLSKDYETAFKLSTELLEKTKPMLTDEKTTSHQIALLATSYYQHAFLLEKLGKKEEAQAQLQKLIDMLDKSLVKFPNDPTLLRDKKGYEKYKGKEIK